MKILTVVGARPQFVKAAVVSRSLGSINGITEVLVHTGQHYDTNMLDIFFEEMALPKPAYQLQIRETLHGAMTGKMLEALEQVMLREKPATVLVYGDTNSTLAATLAASKLQIPVSHVEAGLRSYQMDMPEEINRIVTDRLSRDLFCPTREAILNLEKEGFKNYDASIHLSGDVMMDAVKYYFEKSRPEILNKMELKKGQYFLATVHRAENTNDGNRLHSIISALNQLHKQAPVVVPLHPRTLKYLAAYGITPAFRIVEPQGYTDMLQLIAGSRLILTDSGGLQKEAFFLDKFCITLRDQTEWTELTASGVNILTGANTQRILDAADTFLNRSFPQQQAFYGDGHAGEKISEILEKRYLH